jgi:hypothetical protein
MIARLTAALIVVLYAILGLIVLEPEAVYSGDIGVKYVQAQAVVEHRFASLDIPYPGRVVDPERQFFPMRPPFVITIGRQTQAIFPPASSVLQAVAVAAGGFRGMMGLSILAAGVVLFSACVLAPPQYRLAVAIAVGLGGPLWFYAVSGWEHAPAVALATAAFACAVRPRDFWRWPWLGSDQRRQTPSSPWWNASVASRRARRAGGKARRGRIPGVFKRGATPPAGMHRPSNAAGISPRAARPC